MKYLARLLAACLFSAAIPAFADQIVMKNGDRVTGSIVKKTDDKVTVKSAHFGTIELPWKEIESIKTDGPLVVVLSMIAVEAQRFSWKRTLRP